MLPGNSMDSKLDLAKAALAQGLDNGILADALLSARLLAMRGGTHDGGGGSRGTGSLADIFVTIFLTFPVDLRN